MLDFYIKAMVHYNFDKDLKTATDTEKEVAQLLLKCGGDNIQQIWFNKDKQYDIKLLTKSDGYITFEIKEDFMCQQTGNVAVEFKCRGKASGIADTKADAYIYKIHQPGGIIKFYVIGVADLRAAINLGLYDRIVSGGDEGSNTMNYLFKLGVFIKATKAEQLPNEEVT